MVVVVVPVRMVVVRLGRRLRRLGLHRYRLRRAPDPICERVDAGDERPLQSRWNPGLLPKDLVPKSGCEALRAAACPWAAALAIDDACAAHCCASAGGSPRAAVVSGRAEPPQPTAASTTNVTAMSLNTFPLYPSSPCPILPFRASNR
jgi:hypothetical protein